MNKDLRISLELTVVLFAAAVAAWFPVKLQELNESIWFATYLSMLMWVFLLYGVYVYIPRREKERELQGLKKTWKNKDIDELEERVRKLEESK